MTTTTTTTTITATSTTTNVLPIEIVKRIALYVPKQDIPEFSLVSHQWRKAAIPTLFNKIYITYRHGHFDQREKFLEDMVSTLIKRGYYLCIKEVVLDMSLLANYDEHTHQCHFTPDIKEKSDTTNGGSSMKRQTSVPQTRRKLLPKWIERLPRRNSFHPQQQSQHPEESVHNNSNSSRCSSSSLSQNPCMYKLAKSILVLFQACQQLASIKLDFKRQTFHMSCNAIYLFHRLLITTYFDRLSILEICNLTRISKTAKLNTIWSWIASLNNHTLIISHCTAKFWSEELAHKHSKRQQQLKHIKIDSMLLWDSENECQPYIHWPISLRSVSIIDSPEWIQSDQSPLYQISENCRYLTSLELEVRAEASSTAAFFLSDRKNSYAGFTREKQLESQQQYQEHPLLPSSTLDQAIESILIHCPALKQLSVSGFPGVTDGLLKALLLKKQKSLSMLCLSRNTGLVGSQFICSQLLELGKPIALDYIDIRQNPHLTPVFIQRIKMIHSATKISL